MQKTQPQTKEIDKALEELKDDFKSQLEYIQEIQRGLFIEDNLSYLIRDNSTLTHDGTTGRRRPCAILKAWADSLEEDQK